MAVSLLIYINLLLILLSNGATDNRPNIVLIMTDDQDSILNSMQAMPNTINLMANNGITFTNSFISTPICCASRTETIAGRHFQNVQNGKPKCMHASATYNVFNNSLSMFQKFYNNGYLTGTFGKLTNNQDSFWCPKDLSPPVVKGFNRINGPCAFGYYQKEYYNLYMNGTSNYVNLTNPIPSNYFTSVIGNASLTWMNDIFLNTQKNPSSRKPFITWIGPHAPHYPSQPAGWYADRFDNLTAPRTPSWNIKNTQHHAFVSTNPSLNDSNSGDAVKYIDQLFRDRLKTLLSVDDIVYELFVLLNKYRSELDNTIVVLTSDHGYDLGQLRIPCSKQEPYETAIRIPMYLYGPKNIIPTGGEKSDLIVGNIDLLPTFLDLADIEYNVDDYDGKSWVGSIIGNNTIYNGNSWRRDIYLSQYQSVGTYGFSHCNTWFPDNEGNTVPGNCTRPPETNAINETWYVDDSDTNNWRAIRIINKTMDVMYAEFVNSSWNTTFNSPYFHEYYDMTNDEWQMNNLYKTLSKDKQNTMHQLLMQYGACKGSECWKIN